LLQDYALDPANRLADHFSLVEFIKVALEKGIFFTRWFLQRPALGFLWRVLRWKL